MGTDDGWGSLNSLLTCAWTRSKSTDRDLQNLQNPEIPMAVPGIKSQKERKASGRRIVLCGMAIVLLITLGAFAAFYYVDTMIPSPPAPPEAPPSPPFPPPPPSPPLSPPMPPGHPNILQSTGAFVSKEASIAGTIWSNTTTTAGSFISKEAAIAGTIWSNTTAAAGSFISKEAVAVGSIWNDTFS